MAKTYPVPKATFTFKGSMSSVHCIMVEDNILFAGTQEGKVHLWSLQMYRELSTLTVSSQPILSMYKTDNHILIQDKEMSVSLWTYEKQKTPNSSPSLKEFACLKRSEPKASFCKCLIFQSDLGSHFNKYGSIIDRTRLDRNISLEELSIQNREGEFYIVMPYESKEITTFSVQSRKKITMIDVTKNSPNKLGDVVMCMKLIHVSNEPYLIICTEEGHATLYNIKNKQRESQVKLKTNVKVKDKPVPSSSEENEAEQLKDELLSNTPDTPMAIDFDTTTMRGIVGTSSSNLYCIKLYLRNSTSSENRNTSLHVDKETHCTNIKNEAQFKSISRSKDHKSESTERKNTSQSDGTLFHDESQLRMNTVVENGCDFQIATLKLKMVVELKYSGVSCVCIKPDRKLFVLSHWNGNGIYIYNWRNMRCVSYIDYVYRTINDLYFYNSNTLAVACDRGKVSLWTFS